MGDHEIMHDLAKRMKENYENRQRVYLTRRTPVIIRLDGRAFHTLTKKMAKPFDETFIQTMRDSVNNMIENIQGCKFAFVQSDEVSLLLTDYDSLQTEAWFDYNLCKMVSIAAAEMSVSFNCLKQWSDIHNLAVFDGRAFNVPREEVANYFLWRAMDWHRNSIQMYVQSFFSHKQLQNKSTQQLHELLHTKGKNWTNLSEHLRNGWWFVEGAWRSDILPTFGSVNAFVEKLIVER